MDANHPPKPIVREEQGDSEEDLLAAEKTDESSPRQGGQDGGIKEKRTLSEEEELKSPRVATTTTTHTVTWIGESQSGFKRVRSSDTLSLMAELEKEKEKEKEKDKEGPAGQPAQATPATSATEGKTLAATEDDKGLKVSPRNSTGISPGPAKQGNSLLAPSAAARKKKDPSSPNSPKIAMPRRRPPSSTMAALLQSSKEKVICLYSLSSLSHSLLKYIFTGKRWADFKPFRCSIGIR